MLRTAVLAIGVAMAAPASAQTGVFPEADQLTTICVATSHVGLCEATRANFKDDFGAARRGDYPAQRNVAFCLSSGCDGAVTVDLVEGCAWRMIIQGTPVRKEPTERESFRNVCGKLGNADRREALSRAEAMYTAIYGRQLPLEKLLKD